MAAGAALLAIGTPEALAALSAGLDEYDPNGRITTLAVRAIFRADPAGAYDRLIGYFDPQRLAAPGGKAVPFRVIKTLGPIGKDSKGALQWVDPNAPQWFRADPRWLDLCIALRYANKQLRDIATHVIDYVDQLSLRQRSRGLKRPRASEVGRRVALRRPTWWRDTGAASMSRSGRNCAASGRSTGRCARRRWRLRSRRCAASRTAAISRPSAFPPKDGWRSSGRCARHRNRICQGLSRP